MGYLEVMQEVVEVLITFLHHVQKVVIMVSN